MASFFPEYLYTGDLFFVVETAVVDFITLYLLVETRLFFLKTTFLPLALMTSTFEILGLTLGALPLNTRDFFESLALAICPLLKAARWTPEDDNWLFLMMVVERALKGMPRR